MNEYRYSETAVIGLLADSHGRADTTRRAVEILVEKARADVLIHLGDVCGDTVLDALAGLTCHIVFGNCDYDRRALGEYGASLGLHIDHPCGRILVGEKSLVFAHGDNLAHENEAINACADYFCHGHTHEIRDQRVESTRLVNPGALFRASCYTVVRLEPRTGRLDVFPVESPPERRDERPGRDR